MISDICKLTGQPGKFIKCHLYPQSFYKESEAGATLMLFSGNADEPFKRSPVGIYDSALVIAETEKWFSELDAYGYKLLAPFESLKTLLNRSSRVLWEAADKPAACEIDEFDYEALTLFLLSILWRFAASSRDEAEGVSLGPHFDPLNECLKNRDLTKASQFGIFLCRLTDADVVPVLTPAQFKLDGVRTFQMVFGGYSVYVKTDRRPFPYPFSDLQLKPKKPLRLLVRKFQESRAYASMAAAGKVMFQKYGDPWKGKYTR